MSHLLKKSLVLIAGLTVLLGLGAAPASADTSYEPSGSFATTTGPGDGEVIEPQHVAVRSATGQVFVSDRGNNRVQIFTPDGGGSAVYLAQFGAGTLEAPNGMAIDQSNGDVYVSDGDDVLKFVSDGAPTPTYMEDGAFAKPGVTGPIAFDQSANQLLVADTAANTVRRYSDAGSPVSSFDGAASGQAFTALKDIAVQDDGDALVVDGARVLRFADDNGFAASFGDLPGTPAVVTAVPGTDNAIVGESGGYNADFTVLTPFASLFRYTGDQYKGKVVLPSNLQGLQGLAVSGDSSRTLFAVTGPTTFIGGDVSVQLLAPFAVSVPDISDLGARPSERGARLAAKVNPNRDDTKWTFEYGPTTSYGKQFPLTPVSVPAGSSPVAVARTIGGLEPDTTYHFRVVATNGGGTTNSPDVMLRTKEVAPPAHGANDRAYEQVSPVDKNDNQVDLGRAIRSSLDGDSVTYSVFGAMGGALSSNVNGYYRSFRTKDGWTLDPLDPPTYNDNAVWAGPTIYVSDDQTRSVVVSRRALTPGATERGSNMYLRDDITGALTLMATEPTRELAVETYSLGGSTQKNYAATPNLSQFVFVSKTKLTEDAPATGKTQIYEWAGGKLRLAGILPDGSSNPQGTFIWPTVGDAHILSDDGRRLFFQTSTIYPFIGALYVRTDGQETRLVSGSKRAGDDPEVPHDVYVMGASRDGNVIVFVSPDPLTENGGSAQGGDVYRYQVDSGELENLSAPADLADRGSRGSPRGTYSVMSEDGEYVYFLSDHKLAPGGSVGGNNVYVWHDGETRLVAAGYPLTMSLSQNGRYFVLNAIDKLTADDNTGCKFDPYLGNVDGACPQVYVYDAVDQSMRCASCAALDGVNRSALTKGGDNPDTHGRAAPREVLDDGRVYFRSSARLVTADVNGVDDVYEWTAEKTTLISTGKSRDASRFGGASPDGRDVFFLTSERLVAQDVDDDTDLYDARVGGGIPAQNVRLPAPAGACKEDACQKPGARPAPATDPSTETMGAGNPAPGKRAALSGGRLDKQQLTALGKGRRVTLRVTVNRAGWVRIAAQAVVGRGLRTVASGSRRARGAATVSVPLRLSPVAQRELRKRRTLTLNLRVRFDGAPARTQTAVLRSSTTTDATRRSAAVPSSRKAR